MKIRVVSTCHNEAIMLPFYLRHYSTFADEIEIFDDASTDGSVDIIQKSSAKLRQCPFSGLDDEKMVDLFQAEKDRAVQDGIDWLIVPDIDEILYAPQGVRALLESVGDCEIVMAMGWHMVGHEFPKDDGRQIWEIHKSGVFSGPYCKPIICRPTAQIRWIPGRHGVLGNPKFTPSLLKLLHYRYFGPDYTAQVNTRNFQRRAIAFNVPYSGFPAAGAGSPQWVHEVMNDTMDAIAHELK